jgi:hypothetical protein
MQVMIVGVTCFVIGGVGLRGPGYCGMKRKREVGWVNACNAAAHEMHIVHAVRQSRHGLGIHNLVHNEILS